MRDVWTIRAMESIEWNKFIYEMKLMEWAAASSAPIKSIKKSNVFDLFDEICWIERPPSLLISFSFQKSNTFDFEMEWMREENIITVH